MKKLFLAGIAALFLATGTTTLMAEPAKKWPSPNFVADCRRDRLKIFFDQKDYDEKVFFDQKDASDEDLGGERPGIRIDIDKAARTRLEKELREWRKCDAYYQCLADREVGKVKHCYANDKRELSPNLGDGRDQAAAI
jgi:hypothetical protein